MRGKTHYNKKNRHTNSMVYDIIVYTENTILIRSGISA